MVDRNKTKAKPRKKSTAKIDNDIYTALLGLTVLVLAATAVVVCMTSNNLFQTIFSLDPTLPLR